MKFAMTFGFLAAAIAVPVFAAPIAGETHTECIGSSIGCVKAKREPTPMPAPEIECIGGTNGIGCPQRKREPAPLPAPEIECIGRANGIGCPQRKREPVPVPEKECIEGQIGCVVPRVAEPAKACIGAAHIGCAV